MQPIKTKTSAPDFADLIVDADTESDQLDIVQDKSASREARFFEQAAMEHNLKVRGQELGKVGLFFGSGATAATNIAGVVCLFCCVGIGFTLFFQVNEPSAVLGSLSSILTGTLGYIFGSSSGRSKEGK